MVVKLVKIFIPMGPQPHVCACMCACEVQCWDVGPDHIEQLFSLMPNMQVYFLGAPWQPRGRNCCKAIQLLTLVRCVRYNDNVGVAGSTSRAKNKHADAPMHARQEMYIHGAKTRTRRPITCDRRPPNTHPHNRAPHPRTRLLTSHKHPQPQALTQTTLPPTRPRRPKLAASCRRPDAQVAVGGPPSPQTPTRRVRVRCALQRQSRRFVCVVCVCRAVLGRRGRFRYLPSLACTSGVGTLFRCPGSAASLSAHVLAPY